MAVLPPSEKWYCWKEYEKCDDDETCRLLTPWADPYQYEFPMDWIFSTPKEAIESKAEVAPDEKWVLVKMTLEPVGVYGPETPNQETQNE